MHWARHPFYGYVYQKYFPLSWYRVITAAAPRMATQNALNGQPTAFERTVFFYSFNGILGTCWRKPATCRCIWGNGYLIKSDRKYQQLSHKTIEVTKKTIHVFFLKEFNSTRIQETICSDLTGLSDSQRKAICTFFRLDTSSSHKISLLRR